MTSIFKNIFGDTNLQAVLQEDARAIKSIGEDSRTFTYLEQNDQGYVTAKSYPVVIGKDVSVPVER